MIKTLGKKRIEWHETGGPTSDGLIREQLNLKHQKESSGKIAVRRREHSGLYFLLLLFKSPQTQQLKTAQSYHSVL